MDDTLGQQGCRDMSNRKLEDAAELLLKAGVARFVFLTRQDIFLILVGWKWWWS